MSIISPFPDVTSLAVMLGVAQIINIKPHAPMKDSKDLSSNAYASFLYVPGPNPSRFTLMITVFIAMRKVHCPDPSTNAAHCRVVCPLFPLHSHNILAAHNRAMLRARRLRAIFVPGPAVRARD